MENTKKKELDPDAALDAAYEERNAAEWAFQDGFETLRETEVRRDEFRERKRMQKTQARLQELKDKEQQAIQEMNIAKADTVRLGAQLTLAQKAVDKAHEVLAEDW